MPINGEAADIRTLFCSDLGCPNSNSNCFNQFFRGNKTNFSELPLSKKPFT